jgi:hypothetical protein
MVVVILKPCCGPGPQAFFVFAKQVFCFIFGFSQNVVYGLCYLFLFKHLRCLNNNIWLKPKIKQKAVGANKKAQNRRCLNKNK